MVGMIPRRVALLTILCLVVVGGLGGRISRPLSLSAAPARPQAFTLNGRVTDAITGLGLQATVHFITTPSSPIADVPTAADGSYSIPLTEAGRYQISYISGRCLAKGERDQVLTGDTTFNVALNRLLDTGAFGYTCNDATPYNWVPGTLGGPVALNQQLPMTLPFAFTFYGQAVANNLLYATPHGYVTLGTSSPIEPQNRPIPNVPAPNNAVYAYWAEFDQASVYTTTIGSAPNRQFVVEWRDMRLFNDDPGNPSLLNFEMLFNEGSNDIVLQYQQAGNEFAGRCLICTIGVEDSTGARAFQYLYNNIPLVNNTAVRFYRSPVGHLVGQVTDRYSGAPLYAQVCGSGTELCTKTNRSNGQYDLALIAAPYYTQVTSSRRVTENRPVQINDGQNTTANYQLDSAHVNYNPSPITITLPANQVTNRPLLINNTGTGTLQYRLREATGAQPTGCGALDTFAKPGVYKIDKQWTDKSGHPAAQYHYTVPQTGAPAVQPTNILVYHDDRFQQPLTNTYTVRALAVLGWTYTGFYNDPPGFAIALQNPPAGGWGMVIVTNEDSRDISQYFELLRTYMETQNGRLVFQTHDYADSFGPPTTLFETLGVSQPITRDANLRGVYPVYPSEPSEFIFRCPIPLTNDLLTTAPSGGYSDYGDRLRANSVGLEWAHFDLDATPGNAAIVGRDDGRAVSLGTFASVMVSDGNANSQPDGVDLLVNVFKYVGVPPIPWGDVPWLSESPTSGVVTATTGLTATLTFNTTGLAPGTYTGYVFGLTNDPNLVRGQIQVNLIVCAAGCPTGPDLIVSHTDLVCYGGNCHRPQAGLNTVRVTVKDYGIAPVTWLNGYLYVDVFMDLGHAPTAADQSVGYALVPGTSLQPSEERVVDVTLNIPAPTGSHTFYAWVNRDCLPQVYEDNCANDLYGPFSYCTHPDDTWTFTDAQWTSPFYNYVEYLSCTGAINGYVCGGAGNEPCDGQNRPYFRVGNGATRSQFTKILSNAVGWNDAIPATRQSFQDVVGTNPFWIYVERALAHGVISGYTCGGPGEPCVAPGNLPYFRPGNVLNRSQLTKITVSARGWTSAPPTVPTFEDVPTSSPFFVFIERAYQKGIISGYGCGGPGEPCIPTSGNRPYFRPFNQVTRGQLSKITTLAVTQPAGP